MRWVVCLCKVRKGRESGLVSEDRGEWAEHGLEGVKESGDESVLSIVGSG